MVDPATMCDQHLLGEHVEMHMIVGALEKGYERSVAGLATAQLVDTAKVTERHATIAIEMVSRGMNHHTPLTYVDRLGWGSVDPEQSKYELHRRCRKCRERAMMVEGQVCSDCPGQGSKMCCFAIHAAAEHDIDEQEGVQT